MTTALDQLSQTAAVSTELASLAERLVPSVVAVRTSRSTGSGVIWNASGVVVTNHHVVPGEQAEVVLADGRRRPAEVFARAKRLDLAALRARDGEEIGQQAATIGDSSAVRPGELVVAMGNPYGERNALALGVVIAGVSPAGGDDERIHATIRLRPGNSGGALADVRGRVIGIPHLVLSGGLGLSVPSNTVNRFLQGDGANREWLGILGRWVPLPQPVVAQYNLSGRPGLLVLGITPGSPAEKAGFVLGDVLVDAGDSLGDLSARLAASAIVPLRLATLRAGALHWVEIHLP
ncbi:MAG TPA: trypsin-like peptidase domain-containing protein [Chloroflexota bacterium]|nr:trypsin-like peptidase domain-containing protein [Chloroflexota bacterium]